jgi:hypothetical protein
MDAIDAQANEIRKQIITLPPDDPRRETLENNILALYRMGSAAPEPTGTTALTGGGRIAARVAETSEEAQLQADYRQWKHGGLDPRQAEAGMFLDSVYDDETSMEHRILTDPRYNGTEKRAALQQAMLEAHRVLLGPEGHRPVVTIQDGSSDTTPVDARMTEAGRLSAAERAEPGLELHRFADGSTVTPDTHLELLDTIRRASPSLTDQAATKWLNGWYQWADYFRQSGTGPNWEETEATLRGKWGNAYDANVSVARMAIGRLQHQTEIQALLNSGLGDRADVVEMFFNLGNTKAAPVEPPDDPSDNSEAAVERRLAANRAKWKRLKGASALRTVVEIP